MYFDLLIKLAAQGSINKKNINEVPKEYIKEVPP
jgi:hypothetical protein